MLHSQAKLHSQGSKLTVWFESRHQFSLPVSTADTYPASSGRYLVVLLIRAPVVPLCNFENVYSWPSCKFVFLIISNKLLGRCNLAMPELQIIRSYAPTWSAHIHFRVARRCGLRCGFHLSEENLKIFEKINIIELWPNISFQEEIREIEPKAFTSWRSRRLPQICLKSESLRAPAHEKIIITILQCTGSF